MMFCVEGAVVDDALFFPKKKTVLRGAVCWLYSLLQEMSQITTITSKTTNVHGEEMIVTTGALGGWLGWVAWEGWDIGPLPRSPEMVV